jgi:hypothetical protein
MIEEFGHHCSVPQEGECALLLEMNQVHVKDWYIYAAVLLGIFLAFRTLAIVFLRAKAFA